MEQEPLRQLLEELRALARASELEGRRLPPSAHVSRAHHAGEFLAFSTAADKVARLLGEPQP